MGVPFFIQGDTPWSLATNLTRSDIALYLDDRRAKGFNAIIFQLIEHWFTSQTPRYRNKEGNDPFSPMTDFGSPNLAYWTLVDYVFEQALARGMLCLVTPAYWGIPRNSFEGWNAEVLAASDSSLINYGRFLATRYRSFKNIVWVMGGDANVSGTDQVKQNRIAEGILQVDPAAMLTAHAETNFSTRSVWSASWVALDAIYKWEAYGGYVWDGIGRSYALSPRKPCFLFEGQYDGESADPALCRRQAYQAILAGGCGHFFGSSPIWHFNSSGRDQTDWRTKLSTTATEQIRHVKTLFTSYKWWLLEPRTDTQLVTTSLSSGSSRICPALAIDGSFAMVWTVGTGFSVNMGALKASSVRARWYDTLRGTYTLVAGSPFANVGSHSFTPPGESVLVLDPAV